MLHTLTWGLMTAGARQMATLPLASVMYGDIARDADVEATRAREVFPTKFALADAILDHERASMRAAIADVTRADIPPLEKIVRAFEVVGSKLASDIVVRAGVRLASESRDHFPHRRLDPFQTWSSFVSSRLLEAQDMGELHDIRLDIDATVRLFVSAGMGTKDLIAFDNSWASAETQMGAAAMTITRLMRRNQRVAPDPR